jgi:hypothetical protein
MVYTRTFLARLAVAVSEKSEAVKKKAKNFALAIPAGLIAAAAMTVVMLMAPVLGIPAINLPRVLGWLIRAPLSVGMVLNFLLGMVMALLFAAFYSRWSAIPGWVQGVLFGMALWFFLMIVAGPLIGWGLFGTRTASPMGTLLTSVLGHLVFGWTLGFTYGKIELRTQSQSFSD